MITKGKSTTGRALAAHLLKPENDRVEVWEIRGAVLENLREAIDDWRDYSKGTACEKPIYHAQLNPDRDLSREEWEKAIAIFEKEMGLEGYPRAVVLHEKEGREHLHLVYSRFNHDHEADKMWAWSDSWNYPKHEQASREIERVLGLERVQGVHVEKDGKPRPDRTPTHDAMQQAKRTKIDPRTVKADVSALYASAEDGRAFVEALEANGYTLAKGDRRAYVVLDQAGGVHSLTRASGAKVGELGETLKDFPLADLPTVQDVRDRQREQREQEKERTEQGRAAHLGATLYDRGGMASQQQDALRDVREREKQRQRRLNAEARKQPNAEGPRHAFDKAGNEATQTAAQRDGQQRREQEARKQTPQGGAKDVADKERARQERLEKLMRQAKESQAQHERGQGGGRTRDR